MNIFSYLDYRDYLLAHGKATGRGFRARLARELRCQTSFISQVLGGAGSFSLEHGLTIAKLLGLDEQEQEYFLFLIIKDRAGGHGLRDYAGQRLKQLARRRAEIQHRIKPSQELDETAKARYYASWKFQAVHMATSIPELHEPTAIARHLGLNLSEVTSTLEQLVGWGLVSQSKGRYQITSKALHLASDSPWLQTYHNHWRLKAISASQMRTEEHVHFTSLVTLSAEDASRVREILLQAIEKTDAVVGPSSEQKIWALTMDWFAVR